MHVSSDGRSEGHEDVPARTQRRFVSAGLALVLVVAAAILAWRVLRTSGAHNGAKSSTAATITNLAGIQLGWTKLPPPPEIRDGNAFVWAGSKLLVWGDATQRSKITA